MLHIIATDGVPRGEEITVSDETEAILCLPNLERSHKLFRGSGFKCECRRCTEDDSKLDECIAQALARMETLLAVRPPTDESTKEALSCFKELDKALPFSMQIKAKAKVLLASSFTELNNRAAWQEEHRGANMVQWTGLDAEAQEQRLKDTKKLFETAAKDFEYLLGQDALGILQRMEAGYEPVRDQHKILSKYAREKERSVASSAVELNESRASQSQQPAGAGGGGAGGGGYPTAAGVTLGGMQLDMPAMSGKEGLPPGWEEIFQSKRPAGDGWY